MTSWSWMKGIDVAIADPISPVTENDKRASVTQLIIEHRDEIDKVKAGLFDNDPLYDPKKHDDLWILRFVLSHKKNVKKALKAAKYTLVFRKEHNIDEWGDIRGLPPGIDCDKTKVLYKYLEGALQFFLPDPKRGMVLFLRSAKVDEHSVVKNEDESAWLPFFTYFSEFSHQWSDYVTRTTGRLTKQLRIIDMKGISMSKISIELKRREGKVMSVMEDCYPQLLGRFSIYNAPTWIQVPWRIIRPLLPKRVVQKVDFINPSVSAKEMNRLLKFISEEHLAERYGGKNPNWPLQCEFSTKTDLDPRIFAYRATSYTQKSGALCQ